MKLAVLSAPRPFPATALEGLARSALTSKERLAFLTVVVQSDSKILRSPKLLSNKGSRSRKRASRRMQAQKSAVDKSLSWLLNRLAWVESIGRIGPWVCTIESSSLSNKYTSFREFEHRQNHSDIFHLHAIIDAKQSLPDRKTTRESMIAIEGPFSIFGDALCIPAGPHEASIAKLADYASKPDSMADALVSEIMQSHHTDAAPSRFFASESLLSLTSPQWTRVATTSFPYGS